MRSASLVSFVLAATAASPAWSQTSFDGTKQGFGWTGDCSTAVVFRNDSGVDLCDLWVEINDDGANNPPEVEVITVQKGAGGADWDADDNEDGDDDDANENDDTDSTPGGNAKGWHRSQAVTDADCIAPGANFTVTVCAAGGASLAGKSIYLWGTTHGAFGQVGGDSGVKIADKPKPLSMVTPSGDSHIAHANLPGDTEFSLRLLNDDPFSHMQRVRIVPEDPDFDLLNIRADVPFVWDAALHELNFTPPLTPTQSTQIWLKLDHMSNNGTTTDVGFTRLGDPPQPYCTPKQNSQGCFPSIGWFGYPSVSSVQPFTIYCQQVINQKSGLLFYGFGSHSGPFQGGTLCVRAPIHRTSIQNSGGTPPPDNCSGMFMYDFKARILSGVDPLLTVGAQTFAQWWYRDPLSPSTTGLSNGLKFTIDS